MIELVSIVKAGHTWYLNKVIVNPEHISVVSEANDVNKLLSEGKIEIGLTKHATFSRISMSSRSGFDEMVVVGSPTELLEKIRKSTKKILKG